MFCYTMRKRSPQERSCECQWSNTAEAIDHMTKPKWHIQCTCSQAVPTQTILDTTWAFINVVPDNLYLVFMNIIFPFLELPKFWKDTIINKRQMKLFIRFIRNGWMKAFYSFANNIAMACLDTLSFKSFFPLLYKKTYNKQDGHFLQ